jgi:hypothetical protein
MSILVQPNTQREFRIRQILKHSLTLREKAETVHLEGAYLKTRSKQLIWFSRILKGVPQPSKPPEPLEEILLQHQRWSTPPC